MNSPVPSEAAPRESYILRGTMLTDGFSYADAVVAVAGGRIAYAGPRTGFNATAQAVFDGAVFDGAAFDGAAFDSAVELDLPPDGLILPGLIDLHCHGAAGAGFPTSDSEACRDAVEFLHRSGTTTLLASLVTASGQELLRALGVLRVLASEGLIAGVHSEGPFLSPARCGAQNPEWLRNPDFELLREMLAAAGGTLKTMTYAPELPGAGELVTMLAQHGVTPSLGHTDADARTAAASLTAAAHLLAVASDAGRAGPFGTSARPTVTHLFNAMPPLHHRSPGPVAACLRLAAAGAIAVELIGDGVHLDPETVRMVFELVGADNIALVTDSMAATGLPDGDFELGPSAVVVRDGVASLPGSGALAGGTATLLEVVRRTIAAGVSPADAVKAATLVPARILGLDGEAGSLRTGRRADVVAVDGGFGLHTVLRAGRVLTRPGI
ncbi:N-acetylglucosamine-6-phosphate deacetylase [Arthrobacter sp. SO5]|uniref:N-acetylglucosamine-6-phosphate deacetylase n=1 Tax=Arthrobacter sp. SO5 TaxID=1897055 RepID=UPI001E5A84A8|nr:N-acetylglucosamine-6-phosphate deacetylase [Arthrobacter sp. SO5]MCB5273648.1 N-acetylglucosamine-6-phosphate deacetylase [Arthrobacter sp. SO5]